MRGNSVIDDLRILVNNPRYSDLEIKCKDDVIVYGNRAILAARSEAFDEILFAKTEIYEKQILFQTIEASHMKIILDYLYTGSISERDLSVDNVFEILHAVNFFRLKNLQDFISEYYKKMCRKWGNDNKSPELLSKAAHLLSSLPNNEIVDYLIDSVAKIPLDSIGFNRLTLQGLQCLLSKRNEKKFFASSEYSVLRYAVLTAAKKVSQEAFLTLKKRLPPWEDVKRTVQIINHNSPIKEEISLPVFNYINSLVGYIDFRRISAEIVIKLIEPLYIVPFNKIIDSCRFQICEKSPLSEFYGTPGITWDRNSCGSGLIISDDGYTVSARQDISLCQSVKVNYPMMNSGVHEFHVLLEKISVCSWIGVCGEGLKFSEFAGYHNAHVLGSEGDCYINNVYDGTKIPSFSNDNTYVIVHLDMDNKTIAFSVNGTRHAPTVLSSNLQSNLYFVASLRFPGKFKILPP